VTPEPLGVEQIGARPTPPGDAPADGDPAVALIGTAAGDGSRPRLVGITGEAAGTPRRRRSR
jgi:hypothetical protein